MHEDRSKTVELEFYSVQLREKIAAPDTDINITLAENGRRHARATVQRDGTAITLFTFLPCASRLVHPRAFTLLAYRNDGGRPGSARRTRPLCQASFLEEWVFVGPTLGAVGHR